jgi:thiamine monophosphate kinase
MDRVPVAPEARRVAEARGWDLERLVLGGGEDFELLVTLPRDELRQAPVRLTEIGSVVDEGLWLLRDGAKDALPDAGWDHFKA